MSVNGKLLGYLQEGVTNLLEAGHFENGREFRPTQRESLLAYKIHLERPDLSDKERLTGYFEIPTGIGKTALFSGLSGVTHALSVAQLKDLRTVIVVPTIELLTQTRNGLEQFSPSLVGRIGLYGGEKDRDLSRPVSIITYDSWLKMMETGELHSGNVDLLISDEAHRGTSVRKLTSLFNSFDERTARIAFTATAHFDKTKSVQKTHHHEIFYKSLADGVRGGELAAYVQTQMHIIRVEPPENLSPEFRCESEGVREQRYRRALKQAAWNKAAVAFYRDSVDQHTGDPVSDNQAGFFTDGVHQAIALERLLNADPLLSQKAKESDYKGVALAVYAAKMSPSEQSRRIESYKRGEYLVIVGDEKFKEGFDHAPMKTIIDFQHGSLVDKAQILGRGARQWANPAKDGRAEGLTFVDTIIYVGSNNPKENERLKKSALYKAVTAWEILEGTVVLGPGQEERPNKGYELHPSLNIEGVESYVDPSDVNTLFSEREKLRRENWIEITEEMRQELNSEMNRVGIGGKTLFKKIDRQEGLSDPIIDNWRTGRTKSADPNFWVLALETCKALPDALEKIEITEEMRLELDSEMTRTGVGARVILKNPDAPEGLERHTIHDWRSGASKTAITEHWHWLISAYGALSATEPTIPVTEEMRQKLDSEMTRTRVGSKDILKNPDAPEGLKVHMIEAWRSGASKTAITEHWHWLIEAYAALPDADPTITITEDMRQELNSHVTRTVVGAVKILNTSGAPEGLTPSTVEEWRSGGTKTAVAGHWDWLISAYAALPDAEPTIPVTEEMRQKLDSEMTRTRVGSKEILKNSDAPEGLKSHQIDDWRSDGTKTAVAEHWNWLMEAYAALPDARPTMTITEKLRQKLSDEIRRTGVGSTVILKRSGAPEALKSGIIESWKSGKAKLADTEHWNWLIEAYAALPDARPTMTITEKLRQKLSDEITRTGVGSTVILKRSGAPEALKSSTIENWKSGKAKLADTGHWNWLTEAYTALPDKGAKPSSFGDNNKPEP